MYTIRRLTYDSNVHLSVIVFFWIVFHRRRVLFNGTTDRMDTIWSVYGSRIVYRLYI